MAAVGPSSRTGPIHTQLGCGPFDGPAAHVGNRHAPRSLGRLLLPLRRIFCHPQGTFAIGKVRFPDCVPRSRATPTSTIVFVMPHHRQFPRNQPRYPPRVEISLRINIAGSPAAPTVTSTPSCPLRVAPMRALLGTDLGLTLERTQPKTGCQPALQKGRLPFRPSVPLRVGQSPGRCPLLRRSGACAASRTHQRFVADRAARSRCRCLAPTDAPQSHAVLPTP